jgi:hypothetical protein
MGSGSAVTTMGSTATRWSVVWWQWRERGRPATQAEGTSPYDPYAAYELGTRL